MKQSLREKISATIFMVALLGFSGFNIYSNGAEIAEIMGDGIGEIEQVEDVNQYVAKLDSTAGETLLNRMDFIELYGGVQLALGKQEFNNFEFVKDDQGVMYYGKTYNPINTQVEVYAKRVRRLNEYVQEAGVPLLYVMPPDKSMSTLNDAVDTLPINNNDASIDLFLWKLNQNRVQTLDLRQPLAEVGLEYKDLFFKTDHHWTTLAAFYAAVEIIEEMEETWDIELDADQFYTNIDSYTLEILEDSAIGSMGRNVGEIYSGGYEDMQILTPNFDTDYTYTYLSGDGTEKVRTGAFEEALLFQEYLDPNDLKDTEKAYLNLANRQDTIINHENPDGPKLLVLRDSYFSPVAAFLSPMFSEIQMVWANTVENPDFDTEQYVKDHIEEYDYVILEVYSQNLDDYSFEFFQ